MTSCILSNFRQGISMINIPIRTKVASSRGLGSRYWQPPDIVQVTYYFVL